MESSAGGANQQPFNCVYYYDTERQNAITTTAEALNTGRAKHWNPYTVKRLYFTPKPTFKLQDTFQGGVAPSVIVPGIRRIWFPSTETSYKMPGYNFVFETGDGIPDQSHIIRYTVHVLYYVQFRHPEHT